MAIVPIVEKSITAENQFSDWISVDKNQRFSMNIKGTFSARVTMQKSYDGGTTTFDDEVTFTKPTNEIGLPQAEAAAFRVGVKTGDFVSGTVDVRMGRG